MKRYYIISSVLFVLLFLEDYTIKTLLDHPITPPIWLSCLCGLVCLNFLAVITMAFLNFIKDKKWLFKIRQSDKKN